jgi:hypothetical protein
MLVILSGAKDLTIEMNAFSDHASVDEAKMFRRYGKVLTAYVRSLVVCATRDDSERIK